ncbi:MAG: O-antigen ligase family protein [Bacteroidales bacterium]|nr:O-antigen ligase family protein [Bacteroidales bacterium]
MIEQHKIKWVYILSVIYIAFTTLFVAFEDYWIYAIPFLVIIAMMFVFSLDKLVLLIVFLTPLSIKLDDKTFSYDIGASIPTEPLLFCIMLLFFFKILLKETPSKKILKHPLTIAIIANLIWMALTSFTSTDIIVSIKYFISRLWFVIVFYFIGTEMFKNFKNVKAFLWLYIIPFAGVIVYTTVNHITNGLTQKSANWVMTPFYNYHTAYGAALAMFLPVIGSFVFNKKYSFNLRLISFILFALFCTGTVLSYARATWVSLVPAVLVLMIFLLKIKTRYVILIFGIFVCLFFSFKNELFFDIEKNKQDSSTDIQKHIQSISNVSSDASNLERINRWNSAMRMFKEKPVFGWGPGTYQFEYAPYQLSKDKTIISTNFGDNGNAHSEYIGPLTESGILGSLTVILITFFSLFTGIKVYKRAIDKEVKLIVLALILGLVTYFTHGIMNNFLDTDKASVPFWAFLAIFVVLDIQQKTEKNTTSDN